MPIYIAIPTKEWLLLYSRKEGTIYNAEMQGDYDTIIPVGIKAAETSTAGKSIYAYDRRSTVAKAYWEFTREVIQGGEKKCHRDAPAYSR